MCYSNVFQRLSNARLYFFMSNQINQTPSSSKRIEFTGSQIYIFSDLKQLSHVIRALIKSSIRKKAHKEYPVGVHLIRDNEIEPKPALTIPRVIKRILYGTLAICNYRIFNHSIT
jgi:hypothetical protein